MSRRNRFVAGEVRHGWVISEWHEALPAAISFEGSSVTLTLSSKYAEPPERWPEQLNPQGSRGELVDVLFVDENGLIELAECLPRAPKGCGPGRMVEKWDLQPSYVIFEGNGRVWRSVTTIETFVPMLREWLGEDARRVVWDLAWENGDKWLEIDLKSTDSFIISGELQHQIISDSRTDSSRTQNDIHAFSTTRISTNLQDPSQRDSAIAEHAGILDFLTIVYGRHVSYSSRTVRSPHNPVLDINGNAFGTGAVHECEVLRPQDLSNGSEFAHGVRQTPLISSSPDSSAALSRWLKFRSKNQSGVAALKRAICEQSSWENKLLNTAVAFEEFGYRLPGSVESGTMRENFHNYVKRICIDMPRITLARPEIWARRFNAAYKGLKHADNEIPNLREIALTTQQGIGFLRAWCCFKADPENPIVDPYWGYLIDFDEFYPASSENSSVEDWRNLIPDAVWDKEFSRLEKARLH